MTVRELLKKLQAHSFMNRQGLDDKITIAYDGPEASLIIIEGDISGDDVILYATDTDC